LYDRGESQIQKEFILHYDFANAQQITNLSIKQLLTLNNPVQT